MWKEVKLVALGPKGWKAGRMASDVKTEVPLLECPVVTRRAEGSGLAFGTLWLDMLYEKCIICFGLRS